MFPIFATTVGSAGAASITFSSIPSTYTHLQLRIFAKSNNANANDAGGLNTTFNSDTSNSYSYHYMFASATGALSVGQGTSVGGTLLGFINSNNYSASNFTASVIDILDYKNTSKFKTQRSIGGNNGNGVGFAWFVSGSYQKTDAISSITMTPWSGSLMQYSSFALYGIK
jgi:hypothetical protein